MKASVELAVDGMHCNSCGLLVDDAVEELDGVERSTTDVRRGRTRVAFDPDRITPEAIAAAIADVGYTPAVTSQGAGTSEGEG